MDRFEISTRRWTAIVACVATAVYIHTIGHGFVFDDIAEVVRNVHIRSFAHLPAIFTNTAWASAGLETGVYRPLTTASYALNYAVTGLSPWSYHLVNVALHAFVTVMFFRLVLLWDMSRKVGGLAALLFAVHPIHVEAVANVAGRKDLLTAAFVLLMLIAHIRSLRHGGFWLVTAPAAYGAAMLSKETGAVAIGLVILQDALAKRPLWRAGDRRPQTVLYLHYGLLLLGYLAIRWHVVGSFGVAPIHFFDNPTAHASTTVRLMTATGVVGRGLALLLAPVTLSPDYSYRAIPLVESPLEAGFLLTVLFLAAAAAVAVAVRRRAPLVPFALTWYALTLLPASSLILPINTIFAERFLYLPSLSFCLLAGYLLAMGLIKIRPVTAYLFLLGLVAVLGLRTFTYAAVWSDDLSLFTAASRSVQDSTKVHLKLGDAQLERGQVKEAIEAYRRSLVIAPDNWKATQNMASAYARLGHLMAAERTYRGLLELQPRNADALYSLGVVLRRQGKLAEAASLWRRAVDANPNHAKSLVDLGNVYFLEGKLEQARIQWLRAVTVDPTLPTVWYNLGLLYERTGQQDLAREAWLRFLETAGENYAEWRAQVQRKLNETR